jgi:hypothetical protein
VVGGSETANSAVAALSFPELTGAIIGTSGSYNNSGNTITNVFDNNLGTFFDGPTANGCWAGLDFGAGVSNVITQINYCPRSASGSRMVGGIFQGANQPNFSDAVTLYTVTSQPAAGVFTAASIANGAGFRYVRYLSPNGGWGNVAELQFYGYVYSNPLNNSRPPLSLAETGTNLVLSWPLGDAGFALQTCTNIGTGNWVTVTSAVPQNTGSQWAAALPPSTNREATFYRLAK